MSVKISGVKNRSAAFHAGLRSDNLLLSINGNDINNVLDYEFYINVSDLNIELGIDTISTTSENDLYTVTFKKDIPN